MSLLKIQRNELTKIDLINTPQGMTGEEIKKTYNPDIFINAGLYDMKTKTNIVFLEDENVPDGYYFANKGIGVTSNNDICWCSYKEALNENKIKDYISGAPVLVEKGNINISWGNKVSTQIQGKHMRTAIGFNDKEIILYCSDDVITLEVLASRMRSYGCIYAINLDGGGSQYLHEKIETHKNSTRKNKSWFLFYKVQKTQERGNTVMSKYKVTASVLNIRSGAGTNYSVVGTYIKNTEIEIIEQKNNWGKTNKGWICMSYVSVITNITSSKTKVITDMGYLHPVVQELCNKLLQKCVEEGLNVGLFETYRCNERQAYLYEQGSTTIKSTGAHGFCVAFDIVAKDEKGNWTWDTSNKTILNTYKRVGAIGKSLGLEWGGEWTKLVDLPHFQYLGGISLTKYRNGTRPNWWNNWVIGTLDPIDSVNPEKTEKIEEVINNNSDEPSTWAKTACDKAKEKELILGDGSNNYGWHENLTLERFLVIIDKLGLIDKYENITKK